MSSETVVLLISVLVLYVVALVGLVVVLTRGKAGTPVVPPGAPTPQDSYEVEFAEISDTLTRQADLHRRHAYVLCYVGLVALGVAVVLGAKVTESAALYVKHAHYRTAAVIFELIRSAGAAALLAAGVWGILNLASASLDQATRYEKRLVAGRFLGAVVRRFEKEIKKDTIKLSDVTAVFKAWSDSVDSAFTKHRWGSKRSQDFYAGFGPGGGFVGTGRPPRSGMLPDFGAGGNEGADKKSAEG